MINTATYHARNKTVGEAELVTDLNLLLVRCNSRTKPLMLMFPVIISCGRIRDTFGYSILPL